MGAIAVRQEHADETLMERYQQGDVRAFEMLLNRHQRPVFNFIARHVGSTAVAEELMQEAFLRVVRKAETYKKTAKFTTWLYTIARNLCVDHVRRQKHRNAASLSTPVGDGESGSTLGDFVADGGPDVDRQVASKRLQSRLQGAVDSLSDEQREVFLMREVLQMPFKEIAEVVGCPENTVKSRMRYALDNLREQLQEYAELARAAT